MSTPEQEAPGAPEQDPTETTPDTAPATDPPDDDANDPRLAKANREAANYRRQLRDTETQRDAFAARLDRIERADVERTATAAGIASADDMWLATDLADLRDDHGTLDGDRVTAHLEQLRQDRPHWFARRTSPTVPGGPQGNNAKPTTFGEILRGRR